MAISASEVDIPAGYFPYPDSLAPLGNRRRYLLTAPATGALLSTLSTLPLLSFLLYRFISWRRHHKSYEGYNQYMILIMNLLTADLQQALALLIDFHWIRIDAILAPSPACSAQGFFLNLGDLSSGFFVFAIAIHTYFAAVHGRRISNGVLFIVIVLIWCFALLLTILGPAMHHSHYFVRAAAWCWASSAYDADRLALHYGWIFLVQFGTLVIYILVFLQLKRAMAGILPASQSMVYARVNRAARMMVLFPLVYIVLTLPLSCARMYSMAHGHAPFSLPLACFCGTFLSSSGWVDTLLYTLTRRTLLQSDRTRESTVSGINPPNASKAGPAGTAERRIAILTDPTRDSCDEATFDLAIQSSVNPSLPPKTYSNHSTGVSPELSSTHTRTSSRDPILQQVHDRKPSSAIEVRIGSISVSDGDDQDLDTDPRSPKRGNTDDKGANSRAYHAYHTR